MIIEETFTINAPLQTVWDFFFDVDRMAACVPGAEVSQKDENTYEGTLTISVGPIKVAMGGRIRITKKEAPTRIAASLDAKDRFTASMVSGRFVSTLREAAPGQTSVSYQVDINIRGKLGQMAGAVVKSTAKKLSGEFVVCAKAELES
jgi:carbon monoxide dehydrogenase subunit G